MLRAKNPLGGEGGRRPAAGPKLLIGVLLLLALALGVAACGGSSSSSSSSSTSAESSEPSQSSATSENASSEESGSSSIEGKKVTVVGVTEGNPWDAVFNKVAEEKLGAKGVDVTVVGSLEPAGQVQILNQAVAENPDLIILEALDSKAVAPAIALRLRAGCSQEAGTKEGAARW